MKTSLTCPPLGFEIFFPFYLVILITSCSTFHNSNKILKVECWSNVVVFAKHSYLYKSNQNVFTNSSRKYFPESILMLATASRIALGLATLATNTQHKSMLSLTKGLFQMLATTRSAPVLARLSFLNNSSITHVSHHSLLFKVPENMRDISLCFFVLFLYIAQRYYLQWLELFPHSWR